MAADPTLTRAFFQEATSRAGANTQNLKPLYDSTLDIIKTGQTFVNELIAETQKRNEIDRLAKERQMSGFDKIADDTYLSLYEMDEPLPSKVVNALRTRIKELKEEFELVNTYGKNDTEENNNARIRLLGELKRITSSTIKTRENFMTMSKQYPSWNNARIKTEDIETLKSFLDLKTMDMNDDISVVYTSEGLTFVNASTGRSFTTAQMREAMPIIDTAPQVLGNNRGANAQSNAKQHVTDGATSWYDKSDINLYNQRKAISADALLETIKTDGDYVNAATIPLLQGTQSLEDALTGHKAISLSVIENMYIDPDTGKLIPIAETFLRWDRDGDGDVDSADVSKIPESEREAFIANHKEMVKAIVRPDHPAYNKEASRKILGNYFADLEEQAYNNQFNYSFKQKNSGDKSPNVMVGGSLMTAADYNFNYGPNSEFQKFLNTEEDVAYTTPKRFDYEKRGGKIYQMDQKGEYTIEVNEGIYKRNEGLPGFKGLPNVSDLVDEEEQTTAEVPYPKRSITSSDFTKEKSVTQVLGDLEETYKDYPGFKFERAAGQLLITAPDGTEKYISMDRTLRGNKESRDQIQAFIAKYAGTKQ